MAKKPKLVTCTFLKQWRGHAQGAVADLTEERADELLEEGIVVEGEKKLGKAPKADKTEDASDAGDETSSDEPPKTPATAPSMGRGRGKKTS